MFDNLKRLISHNAEVFAYNRAVKAGAEAFRAYVSGKSPEEARPLIGISNEEGFKAGWTAAEAIFTAELKRRVAADMNEAATPPKRPGPPRSVA